MSQKKWFLEFSIYLIWFPIVALLFWLAIELRSAIEIGLSAFIMGSNPWNARYADLIDKYSFAAIICIWILAIILIEAYLRNGLRDKSMTKRFTRIFGPGLLGLFLVDLFIALTPLMNPTGWMSWVAVAVEFLAGGAITYYGYVRLGRKAEPKTAHS